MDDDAQGRPLTAYPRPSVAVDTAVLAVRPTDGQLTVLLIRRESRHLDQSEALPGTFVHDRQRLAEAVARSLDQKVGLPADVVPEQLHVFDDPERDSRGWVMSVAHVVALPWRVVEPILSARPEVVVDRPIDRARGLPFDHDDIVRRAVAWLRERYAERPDPAGLLDEPFTMRQLRELHTAVAGEPPSSSDAFRRRMVDHLVAVKGELLRGTVGKPAQLFRRR
ncbi:NUDIX domain-containing protein [Blastococcus sp. URHD0036]|uniref:NUDIX hydrolase n=1 Tax=Blastococcus sp. URHD0036 TaxID=1380356 RepID=UPI0018CC0586|nr:NUDIX domain-containing protein [Blastococcus sp. URHD0036]